MNLNLQAQGQPGGTFSGTFTDNTTVAGTLSITGFPSAELVLRRQ